MSKEELYEQIERFLRSEMHAAEKAAFEARLAAEPELQRELSLHQQLQNTLAGERLQGLRATLGQVDAAWKAPEQPLQLRYSRLRFIQAIAAVFVLLLMGYWFFLRTPVLGAEHLFAANFQPYDLVLANRSSPLKDSASVLDMAVRAYSNGDFTQATDAFGRLASAEPDHLGWPFYQAVSLLADGKSKQARVIFLDIQQRPDHLFREQAQWYLAMCALSEGDKALAKNILLQIQPGAYKYEEAKALAEGL